MTRARALWLCLAVFALGGAGYWGFKAAGLAGLDAGIASEALLVLLVVGWTGSYLFRVVTGRMTFMEQRRRYRSAYDAVTDDALQAKFDALSPEEQTKLLTEVGQIQADAEM